MWALVSCSGRNHPVKVFAEPQEGLAAGLALWDSLLPCFCVLPHALLPRKRESHPHDNCSACGVSLWKGVLSGHQQHWGFWPLPPCSVYSRSAHILSSQDLKNQVFWALNRISAGVIAAHLEGPAARSFQIPPKPSRPLPLAMFLQRGGAAALRLPSQPQDPTVALLVVRAG